MKLTPSALAASCFLVFGAVMVYGSLTMEASFSGSNEHRWVPLGMSVFVSLLAAWLLVTELSPGHVLSDGGPLPRRFFLAVVPCVLLLAAYAQAQIWFGYTAATFASGVLVFRLFQNSWLASFLNSALATLVLYAVFFRLLKLYNPPGRWLDLSIPW